MAGQHHKSDSDTIQIDKKTPLRMTAGALIAIIVVVAAGVWRVSQWERKLDDIHNECWRVDYHRYWTSQLRDRNPSLVMPDPDDAIRAVNQNFPHGAEVLSKH